MARAHYLLVTIVAGAAVLALEVLAARTMAPSLGSGPVSWSALLATALGMLAIGSLLGGRLSDRASPNATIAWALVVAAVYLVVLSQSYGPALRWTARQPLLIGEIIAAALTQAVPLTTLGIITPIILHHGHDGTGRWAGIVLAAGSSGGIVGALIAGLFLIPALGLARSFLLVAALLAVIAIPVIWQGCSWIAATAVLAALASVVWCWERQESDGVVESLYGQLEIRTTDTAKLLMIDGLPQTGLPKRLMPGEALQYGYLLELSLAMRPEIKTALVVGLGGGLAVRLLDTHGVRCQAIEIDPAVVKIARSEFEFTGNAMLGDARTVLSGEDTRYDLIFLDVCTADRLPWHLFTLEAMRLLRDRLSPAGMLVIQFIGDNGPWSASVVRTATSAFCRQHTLMFAPVPAHDPVGPVWLFLSRDGPLRPPSESVSHGRFVPWRQLELPVAGLLLTDDHFPTELAWAETARQWRSLCAERR